MPPTREQLEDVLRGVLDPELGLDVVSLGLVYGIQVEPQGRVRVELTMTTPACPLAEQLQQQAEEALRSAPGVESAQVRIVWSPPWTPDRLSPEARRALGW